MQIINMRQLTVSTLVFLSYFQIGMAKMSPVVLDGTIHANEWIESKQFSINFEIDPGNNIPSANLTDVFVDYDKNALYIGFKAFIEASQLRSSIRNRDEAWRDDFVMVCLDTYGDGRYLLCLGSNADNSQLDMKILPSGSELRSYNLNFESKSSQHADSYHVELKIPFSVLQFKRSEINHWNLAFYRSTYTGETRSHNFNFALDRNNPCLACQVPSTIELKGIESKNRVTIIPNLVGSKIAKRDNGSLKYDELEGTFGLSGLLDLNNTTSLEYTINPDFSQVEADVSQVTVNNTFAIQFPERRPYFNEGNDIIDYAMSTVYTRSINQPLVSSKLISQGEKSRIYHLTAIDENSLYLIAGEESSILEKGDNTSYINILRYQRNYQGGSNIGFISTNRFFEGGGSGNLFGIDATWRFDDKYILHAEFNKNYIVEPDIVDWVNTERLVGNKSLRLDGEKHQGDALLIQFRRTTENWRSYLGFEQSSPFYQTPLGFVTQNNLREIFLFQGYTHYFKKDSFVKQLSTNLFYRLVFNYENLRKRSLLGMSVEGELSKNIYSEFEYNQTFNRVYDFQDFENLNRWSWFLRFNPSEQLNFRVFVQWGQDIHYSDNPEIGDSLFVGSFNDFQISPNLSFEPSIRFSRLRDQNSNEYFFEGYIFRSGLNYQFNNTLSFRLTGEANSFNNKSFVQTLLKWNPNPFTIFYLGGTNGFSYIDSFNSLKVNQVNIYFKLQYQFDI